ncbi:MAG: hypothetical protein K0U54_11865 [Bacteroidetes bacterium]|nr:hypothetical protein [Bacteroidota bacterium]
MQIVGFKNIMFRENSIRSIGIPLFKDHDEQYHVQIIDPFTGHFKHFKKIELPSEFTPLLKNEIMYKEGESLLIFISELGRRPLSYKGLLNEIIIEFQGQDFLEDPYFYFELSFFLQAPKVIQRQSAIYNTYLAAKGVDNAYIYKEEYTSLKVNKANVIVDFYRELYVVADSKMKQDLITFTNQSIHLGAYSIAIDSVNLYFEVLSDINKEWIKELMEREAHGFENLQLNNEALLMAKYHGINQAEVHDVIDAMHTELELALHES